MLPVDRVHEYRDCEYVKHTKEIKDGLDLHPLLSSPTRDFLLRNDGQHVKIDSLKGKMI
ncbi:unnamed protein product [Arabis nemorensis]|uniref:Uncharacterized protein n=1 Tax=Arabis nemorensis TaxID=586526 RepID=A0A565BZ36_9BRAS|nr:unnamed protein product [Arabis nemorensis]